MAKDLSTEEKIKQAAKKIFMQKGLAGARMQDIADEAEINKAMLHYYFRSKQQLFDLIFEEKIVQLFSTLGGLFLDASPLDEKIKLFVEKQSDMIADFPSLPLFVLNELWQNPTLAEEKLKDKPLHLIREKFRSAYDEALTDEAREQLPFEQFLLNMMSLIIYPFMARPIFKSMIEVDDHQFDQILSERKQQVTKLLLQSIKLDS
ncbi:MAG: TetR/AcrR family transcriptional regulator [Saprospiraceae bacterium]|nr:TetR/AcrR family transcriptional regulator [Saprospiraceae bacterium]